MAVPSDPGRDLLARAQREYEQGKLSSALATLDKAEGDAARMSRVWNLRGLVHLEQNELDHALEDFHSAIQFDSEFFLPRLHIGDVFLRQRNWSEARTAYGQLLQKTKVLQFHERARYGALLAQLGAGKRGAAEAALKRIPFPSESPAYYYAQAAWAFANGNPREARRWISTAQKIYDPEQIAWFARPLFDFGWIREKPAPVAE